MHKSAEPQLGILQPWVWETEYSLALPGSSPTRPFLRPAGAAARVPAGALRDRCTQLHHMQL
eukprot:bmy_22526T0